MLCGCLANIWLREVFIGSALLYVPDGGCACVRVLEVVTTTAAAAAAAFLTEFAPPCL